MNKQNEENNSIGAAGSAAQKQKKPGMTLQTITEALEHPELSAEQLPELWRQAMEPGDMLDERTKAWNYGIETVYRRCETYPQHTKLAVIVSGMPQSAWRDSGWVIARGNALLRQATPTQLQQALICEQQHPEGWWWASDHILAFAAVEQITEAVIEQLAWRDWLLTYTADTPQTMHYDSEKARQRRARHIVGCVQQRLHGGNDNAWAVFLGIVEHGTVIGPTIELANAVAQQNGPVRNET